MNKIPVVYAGLRFRRMQSVGVCMVESFSDGAVLCVFENGEKHDIPRDMFYSMFADGSFVTEPALPQRQRAQRVWIYEQNLMHYNVPGIHRYGEGWQTGNYKQQFIELIYENGFVRKRADEVVVMDQLEGIADADGKPLWECDILVYDATERTEYSILLYHSHRWLLANARHLRDKTLQGRALDLDGTTNRLVQRKVGSIFETPEIYDLMVKLYRDNLTVIK